MKDHMTVTVNLIPVIVDREHASMPESCDSWGIKSVRPDIRTYGGYQWAWPGQAAVCDPNALVPANRAACPSQDGDGLCVATSWWGMASGGIPASTMLLVAYASSEVLGGDPESKLRLPRVAVVAVVDGSRLLRESGAGADLFCANLSCADLAGANLRGANLTRADLAGADLRGANLTRADLAYANLTRANLRGANLSGANLTYADLRGANLRGADLSGADLYCANLTDALGADA